MFGNRRNGWTINYREYGQCFSPGANHTRGSDEDNLGDLAAGFAGGDEIVEMSFKTAPVHQAYIEPQGWVARCDADGHGMKLGDLRVYPAEIGGAFGGKTGAKSPSAN